jgi:hypothetical protein
VVKGLPQGAPGPAPSGGASPADRIPLGTRLSDLWRTLLE